MAVVAVFHSVLGVRAGTEDAAARLTAAGHDVHVVDQYDGRSFDAYEPAMAFGEGELGFPELIRRGMTGVADLEPGYVALGFSNGSTMAELCALQGGAGAVVCFAGAMPPAVLVEFGAAPMGTTWPAGVPAQVHLAADDPFQEDPSWLPDFEAAVRAAPADAASWTYPGGHLFTDPSLPEEFDAGAAELAWERVLAFLGRLGQPSQTSKQSPAASARAGGLPRDPASPGRAAGRTEDLLDRQGTTGSAGPAAGSTPVGER